MIDDGKLFGVLSKSDLVAPPQHDVVLVDHNEIAQAVAGADEANIIEVIDHHRLGGSLRSSHPIRFSDGTRGIDLHPDRTEVQAGGNRSESRHRAVHGVGDDQRHAVFTFADRDRCRQDDVAVVAILL